MKIVINNIKSGTVPLIFIPGSSSDNMLPHITTSVNSNYGLTYEIIMWAIDNMLRKKVNMNTSQYFKKKFAEPMGLKDIYAIYQEEIPKEFLDKLPENYFRRSTAIADKNTLSTLSIGCDPKLIDDNKANTCVWASEYPNDGLAKIMHLPKGNSNDIPCGGAMFTLTFRELNKLFSLIINNGVYNGKRIINPQSMDWFLQPKVNALSDTWTFYSVVQVDPGASDSVGAYRVNRDIVTRNDYPITSDCLYVGGANGSYSIFDIKTGNYVTIYCAYWYSSSSVTINGVNVGYRDLATVSKLLGLIGKIA